MLIENIGFHNIWSLVEGINDIDLQALEDYEEEIGEDLTYE